MANNAGIADHGLSMCDGELDLADLRDRSFDIVMNSRAYPVILKTAGDKIAARSLEKRGWGAVEAGGSGETIFRLNQAGDDACAWLDELENEQQAFFGATTSDGGVGL